MVLLPSDTRPRDKRGVIAIITGAHGVRGQVKIRCLTKNPEDVLTYEPITNESGKREFKLTRHGIKDQSLIVSIEGLTDRNEAEKLKGTALYAPARTHEKTSENEWFHEELVGLEARLENGKPYGRITAVHNFGAGDILDIELADGKSEMLPLQDGFVGNVHADKGFLVVFPPDYVETENE